MQRRPLGLSTRQGQRPISTGFQGQCCVVKQVTSGLVVRGIEIPMLVLMWTFGALIEQR